jgi:tRNA C32,U32 (ribose-2'-O)-methylase TrmJ
VIGSERAGLPDDVLAACDRLAHIPIRAESLNAAMAATVALYEATRGRIKSLPGADVQATAVAPPDAEPRIARVPPA